MDFVSTQSWAKEEFKHVEIWDQRCKKSLIKMSIAILNNKGSSFSASCGKSLRQCGSRIFSNESMETEKMQAGHYKETAKRAEGLKVVLVAQDTTSNNFTSHGSTTGLGYIGPNGQSRGIYCHTALVMTEDGIPLGISGQKLWVRKDEERGKKYKRKELPIEEKESYKWIDGLHWAQERLSETIPEIWLIGDRESDVYEYMSAERRENIILLVRAIQPRIIEVEISGEKKKGSLMALKDQLAVEAHKTVELEQGNKSRKIRLAVSKANIRMLSPARQKNLPPLEMSLIYAREEKSGEGKKVEWILLCSKRDLTKEDSLQILGYYSQRWKVERFHYALKSEVFNIEKLQFDDAETLMNAISFYSILAWRTLYLTYYARLRPESEVSGVISEDEKKILEAMYGQVLTTALDAVMAIGRLGGFIGGNKKYPYPGIKLLWIGIVKLKSMLEGWQLAKKLNQNI